MTREIHRSTPQERNAASSFLVSLTSNGQVAVYPGSLRVLAAILDQRRPCTVRALAGRLGVQINAVAGCLDKLRQHGLIRMEPGCARTIRAACRFIPADRLEDE